MCCLFGVVDYKHSLSAKQKNRLLSTLAAAAEARGTDATGIAYNSGGKLRIYKRPWAARFMRFCVPQEAAVVMGHTRMTTQGNAQRNYNNHPFLGHARGMPFALAHNGVLYNDDFLRSDLALPDTKIETDSYIAVQLIEKKNALDFDSLCYMAEQVEGSFSFTVLDAKNNLYIVKGDNPLCLYHFPTEGVYVYASTESILKAGLHRSCLSRKRCKAISLQYGDILRIDAKGQTAQSYFDAFGFYSYRSSWLFPSKFDTEQRSHLDEIKSVAMAYGYTPEEIDRLAKHGFSPEELEEILYCCGREPYEYFID